MVSRKMGRGQVPPLQENVQKTTVGDELCVVPKRGGQRHPPVQERFSDRFFSLGESAPTVARRAIDGAAGEMEGCRLEQAPPVYVSEFLATLPRPAGQRPY